MKIYAFEWCSCIYESAFATVSLHRTKRGAFKAMTKEANRRWYEERKNLPGRDFVPLQYEAWRVSTIEVLE